MKTNYVPEPRPKFTTRKPNPYVFRQWTRSAPTPEPAANAKANGTNRSYQLETAFEAARITTPHKGTPRTFKRWSKNP